MPELLVRDPFYPLVSRTLPENSEGLAEVEGARLTALTHDAAYLVDSRGVERVLRPGDRVFLGWLQAIDILSNRAEFVLNKGGIWEHVTLQIEFGEPRE